MYEEEASSTELRQLQAVLEQETKSREEQEDLNSKLQDEYDVLLKKLAEAELHIDQLRLRANVDINKRFILSHQTVQGTTLQQGLGARYSSAWSPTTRTGTEKWAGHVTATTEPEWLAGHVTDAELQNKDRYLNSEDLYSHNFKGRGQQVSKHPSAFSHRSVSQDSELVHPHGYLAPNNGFGHQRASSLQRNSSQDLHKDPALQQNDSHLLCEAADELTSPSLQPLLSQALSDSNSEHLSQMSTSYISTRASAESQHLAQVLQIRSLQEQIASLKEKLESDLCPLEEVSDDLGVILKDHEKLAGNFAMSSEQIDSLQQKYKDKASEEIAQRRRVLENEVSNRDSIYQLLQALYSI